MSYTAQGIASFSLVERAAIDHILPVGLDQTWGNLFLKVATGTANEK
jgi:hypothetical protein